MDPLDALDILARRAAAEPIPRTDVDMRIVLGIARRERVRFFPLVWSAAASALAACIVLAVTLHASSSTANAATATVDPVAPLFNPVQVELP